jgi:hypothetical protein
MFWSYPKCFKIQRVWSKTEIAWWNYFCMSINHIYNTFLNIRVHVTTIMIMAACHSSCLSWLGVLFFAASHLNKSRRKPCINFLWTVVLLISHQKDQTMVQKIVQRWILTGNTRVAGLKSSAKRLKVQQHEGIIQKLCSLRNHVM